MFMDANEDEDGVSVRYCPFELPYSEFGDMMFERRLAREGSSSPVTSRLAESRRGSTVPDTDGEHGPSELFLNLKLIDLYRTPFISGPISRSQIYSRQSPENT